MSSFDICIYIYIYIYIYIFDIEREGNHKSEKTFLL